MKSAFVGLAIVVSCSVAFAQQPRQPQPGAQPPRVQPTQPGVVQPGQPGQRLPGGQPAAQASTADQQIAHCILIACENGVELGKFAQSRCQSQECKDFADKMIKEHASDCETYKRLAGKLVAQTERGAAAAQPRAGGALNWVAIHEEFAEKCLESTKKELSQKQSNEFDQCFIGQQIMSHMGLKDSLEVLRKHASPQLAQQIDQSLETVNAHLKEAKQIAEQQKDRPSERVSRRPEGNK